MVELSDREFKTATNMSKDLNRITVTMSEHTKNLNWKMKLLLKMEILEVKVTISELKI